MAPRIALIACSKTKQDHKKAARELYCSDLFRKAVVYAERSADRWFVLSAKYGLVAPEDEIDPYEQTQKGIPIAARRAWARSVYEQMAARGILIPGTVFVWLAGQDYFAELSPLLAGFMQERPLQGLRQGEQLSFFVHANRGDAPAAKPPGTRVSDVGPPTTDDFRTAIARLLADGERSALREVRVRSGDLHRQVGGYPGPNARMPSCCNAMRAAMVVGDSIIAQPPKRNGASLEIHYGLPRPR